MSSKGLEVFDVPSRVLFGPNAIDKLPELVSQHFSFARRILILTGRKYSKAYAERVAEALGDSVLDVVSIIGDDVGELLELRDKASVRGVDLVVCTGGGRVIDTGKALAFLLSVPLISVPTTASHDGIASPYVSYLFQYELSKRGIPKIHKTPSAIVADTSIIFKAPRRFLISGIGELLGKIVAVRDWELAHKLKGEDYSEFAAKLSLSSFELVIKNVERLRVYTEEAVRIVVKALIGCGVAMAIAGSSRPCSGSEHMFCHALDLVLYERGHQPALHGEQVALGTIMMAYLHGLNWRRLRRIMARLQVPTTARELGVDRDLILEALLRAHRIRPDRYTILGSDGLTRRAAESLIEVTGVA